MPELDKGSLAELRAQEHDQAVNVIIACGPLGVAVLGWWMIRRQRRALAALEAAPAPTVEPEEVIDVVSHPNCPASRARCPTVAACAGGCLADRETYGRPAGGHGE